MTGKSVNAAVNRRGFLRVGGLSVGAAIGAACAPAAAPAPSAPPAAAPAAPNAAFQAEWDRLVADAKKEGMLSVVVVGSQAACQPTLDEFEKLYGVKPEKTTFPSANLFTAKAVQEQKAGVYTFDISFIQASAALPDLRPVEGIVPIRPLIMRPDVLDDKVWRDGYEAGFVDDDKKWGFGFLESRSVGFWINTDQVKEGEITSGKDLLNPKWKGKFIFGDPRVNGYGFVPATALRLSMGDAVIKQLFVDQQPVLSRDTRQITEAMVRGQYALGLGVVPGIYEEMKAQGLGKNLKEIFLPEAMSASIGHQAWALARMPHPNATKLFLNWLLTKDGQASWAKNVENNSRRLDVPVAYPDLQIDPKVKYWFKLGPENTVALVVKTQQMAAEALK